MSLLTIWELADKLQTKTSEAPVDKKFNDTSSTCQLTASIRDDFKMSETAWSLILVRSGEDLGPKPSVLEPTSCILFSFIYMVKKRDYSAQQRTYMSLNCALLREKACT